MQQVQQRELPERISWARALIFAIGYFFLAAILVGQIPGYIYNAMTSSTLEGFEQGSLSMGVVFLGCFFVIMTIVMLFDPKPVVPPVFFSGLGTVLAVVGLGLAVGTTVTGNQYFPSASTNFVPLLGGKFLWFQPNAVDFLMLGLMTMGVGLAMVFYSVLAMQEQKNPDRRDLGTTPAIRWMMIGSILLLIVFLVAYTYLPWAMPFSLILNVLLGLAVILALGSFALRLHYLMRPVRKNTMSGLYAIGALGLAQLGAVLILAWFAAYPLISWMHTWPGLGPFLTICSKPNQIPASCFFSPDAGYLVDAIVTTNFFVMFLAAVWAWKSNRNLVVVGSIVTTGVIAITALIMHTAPGAHGNPGQLPTAMMLCVGILALGAIWSVVARREFAVVGESNLGCLGMWLVMGTCLFIYLGAFAFFSIPVFGESETPPNIPYGYGGGTTDAFVMLAIFGVLAAIQFYFLVRNRYRV